MIPASFDYHSPQSLEEALSLLQSHRDDVKVLSGGQSLLPLLKLRLGSAGHLVDIGRIPDLEYIRGGGRRPLDRRPHPRVGAGAVRADPNEISAAGGDRGGDRRSPGAQHGHRGRQPGAWRSGERSSGHHAGIARRGGGHGPQGQAHHSDRSVRHIDIPITPEKVWNILKGEGGGGVEGWRSWLRPVRRDRSHGPVRPARDWAGCVPLRRSAGRWRGRPR